MHEISSISKRNGKLIGQAKDPVSAGRTLCSILPENFWRGEGGQVFCIGSGGGGAGDNLVFPQGGNQIGRTPRNTASAFFTARRDYFHSIRDVPQPRTQSC